MCGDALRGRDEDGPRPAAFGHPVVPGCCSHWGVLGDHPTGDHHLLALQSTGRVLWGESLLCLMVPWPILEPGTVFLPPSPTGLHLSTASALFPPSILPSPCTPRCSSPLRDAAPALGTLMVPVAAASSSRHVPAPRPRWPCSSSLPLQPFPAAVSPQPPAIKSERCGLRRARPEGRAERAAARRGPAVGLPPAHAPRSAAGSF